MRSFSKIFDYRLFAKRAIDKIPNGCEDDEFLRAVEDTGFRRIIDLPAPTLLYRAQIGHRMKEVQGSMIHWPFCPDRMKPLPKSAHEGRVNHQGLPCLYLADNPNTARSEIRPWVGTYISLGQFVTVRDLRLMDCTTERRPFTLAEHLGTHRDRSEPELEERVWGEISYAFSEPVTEPDKYRPTQVLAEIFKRMDCDGIKYKSLLCDGGNSFALFDLNDAKLLSCTLCKTEVIKYEFSYENRAYEVTPAGYEIEPCLPPDDGPGREV